MTHSRLAAPMGLLINRDKTRQFDFEGECITGYEGDTIASALVANGHWLMSRSFKYHRPRGPLTFAGQDANTLVQLGGEPNVLADRQPIAQDINVKGQNYVGSLKKDKGTILGLLSRFLPVGFYYRTFFKPMGIWDSWEKIIRKSAGLGKLDLTFKPEYYDKAYQFYDLVVVGAGPAGLKAALKAANAGVKVLLVEENPILGGSLCYHRFDVEGRQATELRTNLTEQVNGHKNIEVMLNATCNAWFTDNYLPIIQAKRLYKVRAKECIVASGAFEQHVVFRNNDLPGIVMSSAAERLLKLYAIKPGQRAVIVTVNDMGYMTALDLAEQGVDVAAVVDMRSTTCGQWAEAMMAKGITVKLGYTVYQAHANKAKLHLNAVEVRKITGRGCVDRYTDTIECDLLCMSAGYMPAYQLLCQAGGKLSYDDESASFKLSDLPANLHIAGSVNGKHSLTAVQADGERAAEQALVNLGLLDAVTTTSECDVQVNYDWPIFAHPQGKDFVDFDEDLQTQDIVNTTHLGYRDVQLVKRFSTVGMGPSQGRHSALPTARLVADATQRTVAKTGVTTARPPFGVEKLAHMAGRRFDPIRRTAMHQRHLQLGATMMPAGNWQRPAFYGPANQRDHSLQQEVTNVRNHVGIIDVSTLGGIEVRGPDAAEFMNRIYTFAFIKQPVGRTRYAVLTNQHGVVIDDGVACRISDEHFYVTATTGGVERVYRDMTQWNAQWRLDVDIYNVTSAFAAVNVAGPNARKVLQKLIKNVDLSREGFPYLAYREGTIQNIPVRLLRVGFVGELGYEIHMPTRYGEAIWDLLIEAGAEFGIKPFGVEAQRLLRLEKGHIIIGQDTDGMSHPGEVGLAWAVNRKKPFFVGCRSVDIMMREQQTRKLVGFKLPAESTQPKEGHLVIQGANVSGNITSCEYSTTMGCIIGLAYVASEDAEPGNTFNIRVDNGAQVSAEVMSLPFYDPDNKRQEL